MKRFLPLGLMLLLVSNFAQAEFDPMQRIECQQYNGYTVFYFWGGVFRGYKQLRLKELIRQHCDNPRTHFKVGYFAAYGRSVLGDSTFRLQIDDWYSTRRWIVVSWNFSNVT